MPRSSRTGELIYDSEVEKAAHRRRQETKRRKEGHLSFANESVENEFSMANTQTLRELATPDLTHQPLCITFPTLAENTSFELKSGLIQLLPSFHGSITTWAQLKKKFVEKFFPASRAASLRKEICSIKQYSGESLYDFWERFNKLCTRCPQHQISEQLLIQYFYEGLQSTDRSIIDATSGGALANKTPREAWDLIEAMAENSQQFGFRESNPTRRVNEAETSSIQQQLSELTSAVRQLAMRDTPRAKVCGICTSMDHYTDSCPILQEDGAEQEIKADKKDQEARISQLATAINRLESHVCGKLPSQPEVNPKNVSAMTLRSGKELEGLEKTKKVEKEKELLDVFRKVEINIPLLDAIKQIPKYAKFLKDLCTHKRKLRGDERVAVEENVSAILQRKLPPKCGDPGMFTIPCKIGGTPIRKAMLDLGASINVMSKTIYASLNLGPLKGTGIIIQLADRTNAYPEGLVKDVLVQVNELVFLADFYVLYMRDERALNLSPILLDRPFLSAVRTKIDVNEGTLSMEFDGEIVNFNIF
ncbi:uncharacterized protein [Coffea arabica]|uniref:Retrotransposon gag domain-containing protein n=1 Tax=Coffea arabica TaxID=13443 RepID=A0ABM4U0Z6_COFAR